MKVNVTCGAIRTLLCIVLAVASPRAIALSFAVNSETDAVDTSPGDGVCVSSAGQCTLRAAIQEANALLGPDFIRLPAGNYVLTLPSAGQNNPDEAIHNDAHGDLDILDDVTINGAEAASTFIDGNAATRVMNISVRTPQSSRGPTANVSNLTIRNGRGDSVVNGGGIHVTGRSTLNLTRSVVENNQSRQFGGGISLAGTLGLNETTIRGNTLPQSVCGGQTSSGGGIFLFISAAATIDKSTISSNSACRGGGIYNGGGTLRVKNSTISGNIAKVRGGGIFISGDAAIAFSTITNNRANDNSPPQADILSGESNIRFGGGIYNVGTLRMGNSIVAGNTDDRDRFESGYSPDCWSRATDSSPGTRFTSLRGNLVGIGNANCNLLDRSGGNTVFDRVGVADSSVNTPIDPLLFALTDNGGPTLTHPLAFGSPAIDLGNAITPLASFFNCPNRDQRNFVRPIDGNRAGGAQCDAGAYESGSTEGPIIIEFVARLLEASAALLETEPPFQVQNLGTPSKCLQPEDGRPSIGDLMSAKICSASAAQNVRFRPNTNGSFRMTIAGLCVGSPRGFANGARLQLLACNGSTSQSFVISGGRFAPFNAPDQVMDLNTNNNNDVIVFRDGGNPNQRWNSLPRR
ncbi:MAG: choice-of-anchor Q domain-containing protein [Panacagrimonas sp.]